MSTLQQKKSQHFLEKMGVAQLIQMFDLLPDTLFWIKDNQSRIIHANQVFLDNMGGKSLEQIIGLNDTEFAPMHIAEQFMFDDLKVISGEAVTARLELNTTSTGATAWFSTSKRALKDAQGNIIGSYGVSKHLQRSSKLLSALDAVKEPVSFIQQHFRHPIYVEKLAHISHLSVSALERRFKKHLTMTPKQYITKVRLENAKKLLVETQLSISEVGYQSGFTEHSYFSKQFKALFGKRPSDFRQ